MPSPRTLLHPVAVLGLVLVNGAALAEPDAAAAPVPDSPAAVKELVGRLDGPDVRVLVPAGATTNPLDHLPFTRRLVVFDVSDPRQVTLARTLGSTGDGRRVVYLATRSERASAWDGWTTVEDALDAPVYLLTPDVRARFAIERVPSLVEARGRVFVVTELPPPGSG